MNERIEQLMLEAGFAAPHISTRAHRLVELLIKECANIAAVNQYEAEGMGWNIGEIIKEHFGVK